MELQLLASLLLQAENDRVQGLLDGGIDLFVAAGLLAFERKRPTLGEIYRITASGGDKQKEYRRRADEVVNPAAKLIFMRMASTNNDTLTSYLSLLMTSGLKQWSNPAIDRATATSEFDFRDIRKTPFSVYLVVEPLMVKPLAPLIRLFFSDLLASLQDHEPGKDEPWPVMIMLDEFNRLGKLPIVLDSIETLRSYPSAGDQMRGLQGQIKALEAKIGALAMPKAVSDDGSEGGGKRRDEIDSLASEKRGEPNEDKPSSDEYRAGAERVERFMEEAARG